jgi:hypothetical protein
MHSCASFLGGYQLSIPPTTRYWRNQTTVVSFKFTSCLNGNSTLNESLLLWKYALPYGNQTLIVHNATAAPVTHRFAQCTVWCKEVHYSSQQFQIYLVISLVTSRIGVLQHYACSGVCHSGFEFHCQYALNLRLLYWNTNCIQHSSQHKTFNCF